MSNLCNVIADLLPLMTEGVASEDTAAFVRAHMEGCEHCRAAYARMTEEPAPPADTSSTAEQARPIKTLRRKLRRQRTLTVALSIVLTLALLLVWLCIKPYDVHYGNSTLYSLADRQAAVRVIKREIRTMRGCKFYAVRYAGDEATLRETQYRQGETGSTADYDEYIVFKSDFRAPLVGAGGWNPGEMYYGWGWILARRDGGQWVLLTHGYG